MKFYKAIYTKDPIQKKRKKFEDGFVQVDEATKKILLFSEDGKQVSSVPKGTLVEDRDRGCEYCFVGGFYVELDYEVPEKEFLSGKAFVAEQPVQKEMIAVVKPKFQKLITEKSGGIAKKSTSTEPKSKLRDPEESRSRSRAQDDQRPKLRSAEETEEVILEVGDGPAVVKKIVIEGFLAKRMMRHQIEGVRWLVKRLSGTEEGQRSLGCIFADSMGLGKTLTVIATMFTLLRQSPFEGEGGLVRKCLVVAPLSLVFNWKREFAKWLGPMKLEPLVISGAMKLADSEKYESQGFRVAILSFETLAQCAAKFKGSVDLLVVDEGHKLKNPDSKIFALLDGFRTRRRLLVTGTPLQNSLEELHACLRFACGEVFGGETTFRQVFAGPIAKGLQADAPAFDRALASERATALLQTIRPHVLRRGADVLAAALPRKREFVILCELSPQQRKMMVQCLEDFKGVNDKLSDALAFFAKMKTLMVHHVLYNMSPDNLRAQVKAARKGEDIGPPPDAEECPKISLTLKITRRFLAETKEKIIIVSYSTKILDLIEVILLAEGLRMVRLDGSCDIDSRENAIRRFSDESDPVRILLLCSKAGGTGLTLTSATRMILIDVDWNPSNEEQVMARIHRAGQRHPVAIYRLLAGWVEEAMLARQIDKEKLADFALDGGGLELFGGFSEENEFRTVLKGKRKLEDESLVPVDLEDRLELSGIEEGIVKFFERAKLPPAKPSKFHQIMAEIRANESKSLLASAPHPPVPSGSPPKPSPSRENRIRRSSALDSLSKPDAQDLKKTKLEDRLFPVED